MRDDVRNAGAERIDHEFEPDYPEFDESKLDKPKLNEPRFDVKFNDYAFEHFTFIECITIGWNAFFRFTVPSGNSPQRERTPSVALSNRCEEFSCGPNSGPHF